MTTESKLTYDAKGNAVGFIGPDAVALFQVAALSSGLGLMKHGIKPHRSWTSLRAALAKASMYTGVQYQGKKDIERARADLKVWIETMKSALPKEEG